MVICKTEMEVIFSKDDFHFNSVINYTVHSLTLARHT